MDSPPAKAGMIGTVFLVLVHATLWSSFVAGMVFIVPGFKQTFDDFGMKLPLPTMQVIACSDWLVQYAGLLPLPLGAFLALDGLVLWLCRRQGRMGLAGRLWFVLVGAVPLLLWAFAVVAVWQPWTTMYHGLSR